MRRKFKGWAIVTRRGILVGGGIKYWGYIPLEVYSTRLGAKEHLNSERNDIVIPCEIVLKKL